MRFSALLILLLLPALLAADAPRFTPTYRIRGEGLTITPSMQSVTLVFSRGVTINSKDFMLSAPRMAIEIKPTEIISTGQLKLPRLSQLAAPPGGDVWEHPSQTAREMAQQMEQELKLPEPQFTASALRRVEASGGITATAQGLRLSTPSLVSTDGGRSWLAPGHSTLERSEGGQSYHLSAGQLLYDTVKQRAVARGGVQATVRQRGQPDITLSAQQLSFGLATGELQLSGQLRLAYGGFVVTSAPTANVRSGQLKAQSANVSGKGLQASVGELGVNLKQQSVSASGGVSVSDKDNQLKISSGSLGVNLKTQQLSASGGVALKDSAHGVEVSAGSVSANLKTQTLTAGGNPTVRYGGSTFTGQQITVRQQKGKTVVEVRGEQRARIAPGDIKSLSKPNR